MEKNDSEENDVGEKLKVIPYMGKWLGLSMLVGGVMGCLSAFFLLGLNWVTDLRQSQPWLLFLLPVGGLVFGYLYDRFGKNSIRGNNLVIEQARGGREKIPLRLIPLTLFGTLSTHLFGGSVGREGTAVQMGGSVADFFSRALKLSASEREIIIMSGMSAGFGSVFGTPIAGAVFAMEVLIVGRIRTEALFPVFFASLIANVVTESLGVTHTHYVMGVAPEFSWLLILKLFLAAMAFGVVGKLFSVCIAQIKKIYKRWIAAPAIRNAVGGAVVVILVLLLHGQRFTGISTELLADAFSCQTHLFDFVGKFFYTVLSLGAGFQGGEVTPLFEIGATLGADLALLLNVSVPLLAGLGFIGVFSGATNTPIACFIMGVELFGGNYALYFFVVCTVSTLISGRSSIYGSQYFIKEKFEHQESHFLK